MDIEWDEIISIEEMPKDECYDITLLENDVYLNEPNFIAENIVVHNCGVDVSYARRKNHLEEYEVHPIIQPIVNKTYGLLLYQEQIAKMLSVVGGIPLRDCTDLIKAISKKKLEKFTKYKEMFFENGQIRLGHTKEQITDLWERISAFSTYAFNLSHAVSYSYITSRQLYLKTYYPIEYFTEILNSHCIEGPDKDARFRDYKRVIEAHSIKLNPIDLNKSKVKFEIVGNEIYTGFSAIKGIGTEMAQKIVDGQPYKDYDDFINRFGVDAKVFNPFISLGVFPGGNIKLYKYYEFRKETYKKLVTRHRRYADNMEKYNAELQHLNPGASFDNIVLDSGSSQDSSAQEVIQLYKKYVRTIRTYDTKNEFELEHPPTFDTFDEFVSDIKIKPEVLEVLQSKEKAEMKFYGFLWQHPLEKCKHTKGFTLEKFRLEGVDKGPVEGLIVSSTERKGKKVKYRSVVLEDINWEKATINVWMNDYERWADELKSGNLVRIMLTPPSNGFPNYTFYSTPRYKKPEFKTKAEDYRICLLN